MVRGRDRKTVLKWETIGVFFIIGVGSLLHFVYEWSGNNPIVGIFSAVNESVWEHLKLGFWSTIFYAVIEYHYLKNKVNNFFVAKGTGILLLQSFIVVFFYSYTAITGKEILALDISSYVIGAILCQIISYNTLIRKKLSTIATTLSLMFIILHGLALIVYTFNPPQSPIFKDSNTGTYGIEWHNKSK